MTAAKTLSAACRLSKTIGIACSPSALPLCRSVGVWRQPQLTLRRCVPGQYAPARTIAARITFFRLLPHPRHVYIRRIYAALIIKMSMPGSI